MVRTYYQSGGSEEDQRAILTMICNDPSKASLCLAMINSFVGDLDPTSTLGQLGNHPLASWHDGLPQYCHSGVGQYQRMFSMVPHGHLGLTFLKLGLVTAPSIWLNALQKASSAGTVAAAVAVKGATWGLAGGGTFADVECMMSGNG